MSKRERHTETENVSKKLIKGERDKDNRMKETRDTLREHEKRTEARER